MLALRCPNCGYDNLAWVERCSSCGRELPAAVEEAQRRNCVSCGRAIAFDANVCPYCGHDYRIVMEPQQPRDDISTGMRVVYYLLSLFIPIAGIIIGIVFWSRPDPEYKHVGKMCILFAIVPILVTVVLAALLYVMVLGFSTASLLLPL